MSPLVVASGYLEGQAGHHRRGTLAASLFVLVPLVLMVLHDLACGQAGAGRLWLRHEEAAGMALAGAILVFLGAMTGVGRYVELLGRANLVHRPAERTERAAGSLLLIVCTVLGLLAVASALGRNSWWLPGELIPVMAVAAFVAGRHGALWRALGRTRPARVAACFEPLAEDAAAAACPVCGQGFVDEPRRCDACGTPHHEDCWAFGGGCAVYGCGCVSPSAACPSSLPGGRA